MKIPLNYYKFSLNCLRWRLFHLKKDKSHIFQPKTTLCSAAPSRRVCFVFGSNLWPLLLELNCGLIKLIGWFYHHIVFPPIRSVCYRFLHCDYRKLHCCLGLTALKLTNLSSSNIFMYIINIKTLFSCRTLSGLKYFFIQSPIRAFQLKADSWHGRNIAYEAAFLHFLTFLDFLYYNITEVCDLIVGVSGNLRHAEIIIEGMS